MEVVSDEDLARRLQKEEEEHYKNLTAARKLQADEDHKYAAFLAQQLNPSPNVGHANNVGQNSRNRGHGSGVLTSGDNVSVHLNINVDMTDSDDETDMEDEEADDEEEDDEVADDEEEDDEVEDDEVEEIAEDEEEEDEEEIEEEELEETEEEDEEDDDQDDDLNDSEYETGEDDLDDPLNRTNNNGLTNNQIGILPTRTYVARPQRQGTSSLNTSGLPDERECPVCFSAFDDGDLLRTLPCLHHFHSACVDVWLQRQADCPVCREKICLERNL